MLPEDLHNPETEAIGLDVAALEGKSIAEIRGIVDRDDCTLVIATEDVPPELPPEVMRKEPNAHEGKPSLSWMYQTDGGDWRDWYGYIVDHDYVRRGGDPLAEIILAQIYTKRARATPGMRVRPIATLNFDLRRVCVMASDAWPQLDILRIRAEERESLLRSSPSPKSRVATTADPVLDKLAEPFGLSTPLDEIVFEVRDSSAPRAARFGWINDVELRGLILINARVGSRIVITRDPIGQWFLLSCEGETAWPPITLDERGLRVTFRSSTGDAGPAFDVYAGNLGVGIVDEGGTDFTASLFIGQRSSNAAPITQEPAIQLLGHRQGGSASTRAVTARLLHSDQTLEVTSPKATTSFGVIHVRPADSKDAILISARRA